MVLRLPMVWCGAVAQRRRVVWCYAYQWCGAVASAQEGGVQAWWYAYQWRYAALATTYQWCAANCGGVASVAWQHPQYSI